MIRISVKRDDIPLPGDIRRWLKSALHRAAIETTNTAREETPRAFAELANSIRSEQTDALQYTVFSDVDYAAYVEHSTKLGGKLPPVSHLQRWLRTKNIRSHSGMDKRDLAWAIARGIQRRGMRAHPYMQPTAEKMEPRIRQLVARATGHNA